jgi:hypothetical protein
MQKPSKDAWGKTQDAMEAATALENLKQALWNSMAWFCLHRPPSL